jgi:hypothetical protein
MLYVISHKDKTNFWQGSLPQPPSGCQSPSSWQLHYSRWRHHLWQSHSHGKNQAVKICMATWLEREGASQSVLNSKAFPREQTVVQVHRQKGQQDGPPVPPKLSLQTGGKWLKAATPMCEGFMFSLCAPHSPTKPSGYTRTHVQTEHMIHSMTHSWEPWAQSHSSTLQLLML